jgi:polysaccharide biosynthesis protein PelA
VIAKKSVCESLTGDNACGAIFIMPANTYFKAPGRAFGETLMRSIFTIILTMLLATSAAAAPEAGKDGEKENERFVVYYADKAPLKDFKPYKLAVLDSDHHPDLQPLKEEGKILLGYITLGEVNKNSPSFIALKSHNLILQENPNWKDSFYVDVRDPLWAKMVLEDLVPAVLRQGFDGVFLDTLDDAIELERSNPGKYAGMTEAAAHLIEGIRLNYPTAKIMMNRAYGLLPKVDHVITMELGESVYASYNSGKKTYTKVDDAVYRDQVVALQTAQHDNPDLKIFTLDYADPSDQKEIRDIYRTERANGFIPYVSTNGLDRLVDEPEAN